MCMIKRLGTHEAKLFVFLTLEGAFSSFRLSSVTVWTVGPTAGPTAAAATAAAAAVTAAAATAAAGVGECTCSSVAAIRAMDNSWAIHGVHRHTNTRTKADLVLLVELI